MLFDHHKCAIRKIHVLCRSTLGDDTNVRFHAFSRIIGAHYPFMTGTDLREAWKIVDDDTFVRHTEEDNIAMAFGSKIRDIFDLMDTNGDGTISRDEFAHAMRRSAPQTTVDFSALDANADGRITVDEFYAFLVSNKNMRTAFDRIFDVLKESCTTCACKEPLHLFKVPLKELRTRRPSLLDVDFQSVYGIGVQTLCAL